MNTCPKCGGNYEGDVCPFCAATEQQAAPVQGQEYTQPQQAPVQEPQTVPPQGYQQVPQQGYQQVQPQGYQQPPAQGYQPGYQPGYQQVPPQGHQQVPQQPYQMPTIVVNNVNTNTNNVGGGMPGISPKSKMVALILCIFFGTIGIHRFYVGKVGMGILYLLTGGLCGIGWIIDIIQIACGNFRDNMGLFLKN